MTPKLNYAELRFTVVGSPKTPRVGMPVEDLSQFVAFARTYKAPKRGEACPPQAAAESGPFGVRVTSRQVQLHYGEVFLFSEDLTGDDPAAVVRELCDRANEVAAADRAIQEEIARWPTPLTRQAYEALCAGLGEAPLDDPKLGRWFEWEMGELLPYPSSTRDEILARMAHRGRASAIEQERAEMPPSVTP